MIPESSGEPAQSVNIDAALVAGLIASQFPQWADLSITPAEPNGWDNTTFRLGTDMSVRLPSAARYAAQVEKEHHWLPILAPQLPLPIPVPLAVGVQADGYPWHWSVYRWLAGTPASTAPVEDLTELAMALADFLTSLQRIDPTGGPPPGAHNFFRGGPVEPMTPRLAMRSPRCVIRSPPGRQLRCGRTRLQPPGAASRCGSMGTWPPATYWSGMDA
jgi:aminoglycoside phosphotransferase (APT) family kinase protein